MDEAKLRFIDNNDGTVTDTQTGLMWQQVDDGADRNWQDAQEYAAALNIAGHDNWRLPTIQELQGLVDYERYDPAIDPIFHCASGYYGSGSTYASNQSYAWHVGFYGGYVGYASKTFGYYVRCVRTGL